MSVQFRVWQCRDENGELMRIVKHKEEALEIVAVREGWTIQCTLTKPKQTYIPEEAPF